MLICMRALSKRTTIWYLKMKWSTSLLRMTPHTGLDEILGNRCWEVGRKFECLKFEKVNSSFFPSNYSPHKYKAASPFIHVLAHADE